MTKREKQLAVVVGSLVGLMLMYFAWSQVADRIQQRVGDIQRLEKDMARAKRFKRQGLAAVKTVEQYRKRSLPEDVDVATIRYKEWLNEVVESVGGTGKSVTPVSVRGHSSVYQPLAYTLNGTATLEQLAEFLQRFYSANDLHRIRNLTATTDTRSKDLEIMMTIEALILPEAGDKQVGQEKSPLAEELATYHQTILERNLFSPANQAPRLERIGSQRAERGKTAEFTAKASDPDKDKLKYELVGDAPAGAKIDAGTGRFSWRPPENGKFEFEIKVRDEGLPAKEDTQKVTITVADPPPDTEELDKSKYAFVMGIVEVSTGEQDARRQLWLHLRTEDDTKYLSEGDEINAGSIKGVLTRIGMDEIEIRTKRGNLVVRLGDSLGDAKAVEVDEL